MSAIDSFMFSIIIPCLHEAERINGLIDHLRRIDGRGEIEIIAVDGDDARGTIDCITDHEVIPRSRASRRRGCPLGVAGT